MSRTFLVLSHGRPQEAGRLFLAAAQKLSIDLYFVDLNSQAAPDFAGFDALIVLGPTPYQPNPVTGTEEKNVIRAWLALDRPCLCLGWGHLMLAELMNAKVAKDVKPSRGFIPGHLTHDGKEHPLFRGIKSPFTLFKWHDQSIQTPVPRTITPLATSRECVVEAFCVRGRPTVIGLQFENHTAGEEDVIARIENRMICSKDLQPEDVDLHVRNARLYWHELEKNFVRLLRNFKGMGKTP